MSENTPKPQSASKGAGVYCSACGHFNPAWRPKCKECQTALIAPGQVAGLKTRKRPGCVLVYAVLQAIYAILVGVEGVSQLASDNLAGALVPLSVAAIGLVVAVGLWRLKNWARILLVVCGSLILMLNLCCGVLGWSESGFSQIEIGGIVLFLLVGGCAVYWFAKHSEHFD